MKLFLRIFIIIFVFLLGIGVGLFIFSIYDKKKDDTPECMYKLHRINSLEERKKYLNSLSSKEKESLLKFYGFENVSWNLFYFFATSLKEELLKLELELENLQAQENDMKLEVDKLKDPTYLEKYATEKYIYEKDEEYIIKTP